MIAHFESSTRQWINRTVLLLALTALALFVTPSHALAQWNSQSHVPDASAQRSAMNGVRTQMNSLHNATQTARNFGDTGVNMVFQQFQGLRNSFNAYVATLQPSTAQRYANELAELQAGLDVLGQAFDVYNQDLTDGRTTATALSNLTRVMDQASRIWMQQFNRVALDIQTRP